MEGSATLQMPLCIYVIHFLTLSPSLSLDIHEELKQQTSWFDCNMGHVYHVDRIKYVRLLWKMTAVSLDTVSIHHIGREWKILL